VGIVPHILDKHSDKIYPQTYQPVKSDQMCPCFYLHLEDSKSLTNIKQWISEVIHEGNAHVPVLSIATLAHRYRDHDLLWFTGTSSKLTGIAGAIVLFLAALGICAVKGYMVASRTREIGIRKALGATNKNIIVMVYKKGFLLTVVGLVFGLFLGLSATRVIASVLSGYHAAGLIGIAVTIALLGIVSLLAGYGPTRKAAKIDPMEALRYE
jgi:ABC-type antimicrobial peptide transport system permease subunit